MTTENQNQNISPPIIVPTIPPPQENITIRCGICEEAINDTDAKLICTNKKCGKLTCNVCIHKMFEVMFSQPALNYPLLCGACQNAFDVKEVDQILVKQDRYEQFIACVLPLFWSKDCLQENEKLAQCK